MTATIKTNAKTIKSLRGGEAVKHTIEELDAMTRRYTTCKTFTALVQRFNTTGYTPTFKADGNKKREFARACKAVGVAVTWKIEKTTVA